MSKKNQAKNAQRLKKQLKNAGVDFKYRVDMNEGMEIDSIWLWLYRGVFDEDEHSMVISFCPLTEEFEHLCYDEGTHILTDPTFDELVEYLTKDYQDHIAYGWGKDYLKYGKK